MLQREVGYYLQTLHAGRITTLSKAFLIALREERTDRKALLKVVMQKALLRRLKSRNIKFNEEYNQIHTWLKVTRYCRACNKIIDVKDISTKRIGTAFFNCNKCRNNSNKKSISTLKGRFSRLLSSARTRNSVSITINDLLMIYNNQNGLCYLSGQPLAFDGGKDTVSMDRIDNMKGYSMNNTVLSCRQLNLMRSNLTPEKFIYFCKCVTEFDHMLVATSLNADFNGSIKKLLTDSSRRKFQFEITNRDIQNCFMNQGGRCFYSGIKFLPKNGGNDLQISLDRIDSKLGYHPQNIVLCCYRINRMKYDLEETEFKRICNLVAARFS